MTEFENEVRDLNHLMEKGTRSIPEEIRVRILQFYRLVLQENALQNLTRLASPEMFYEGHLLDVLELLHLEGLHHLEALEYPAMDLGSGVGVPGLLCHLLQPGKWVLVESEKRKAEYLSKTVASLEVGNQIQVYSGRVEDFFKTQGKDIRTVVARAVGPVDRVYPWIRKCSTWNKLVFFKGPGWSREWEDFLNGKFKKELKVSLDHGYSVGSPEKHRRIVILHRN